MASRTWDVQDGVDGALESVLGGIEEAAKRKRSGQQQCPREFLTDVV
jgi:hypothetical protein